MESLTRFVLAVFFLCAAVIFSCSPPPPLFGKSPGEQEKTLVRTVPYSYDAVWRGVVAVVDSYRVYTLDRKQGLAVTWWNKTVVRQIANLTESRNLSHGVKIKEHSDSAPRNQGAEFEVQKRLRINATAISDTSTAVGVAFYFKVTPYSLYAKAGDEFGYKSFSIQDFDTREEFRVLDRIEQVAAKSSRR
jgi:hypothetical protein